MVKKSKILSWALMIGMAIVFIGALSTTGLASSDANQHSMDDETMNSSSVSQSGENLVCVDVNSQNPQITPFGELIKNLLRVIILLGGAVAVVFGSGYTMMSAVKPSKDEYAKRRNNSILFGGGTIVVVYGVNALLSTLDGMLDFSCILPFL